MSQKAPFDVTVSEDSRVVDVRFYGVFSNTDWIHLHKDVPWIRMVRWFQDATDVYRLSIETDVPSWWGYDAGYDGGAFVLSLRRPPAMGNVKFPLEGLTVAVDAGHSSDTGAVGITGVAEREVNRDIAARLKKKLEADRARVVMIRSGDDDVPLYDRPKKAWAARADVLISVHNNALPDGENPFEKNGFGVYYYHPMALSLARDIHEAYQGMFGFGKNALKMTMRDDGLHWGNLALPRTPQMPSVLTESAYMIYPPEEWALQQPPFQEDCAEAMRQGLKTYVRRMRPTR
jgi:N-acetylmuramoyl-L-alanine amidase